MLLKKPEYDFESDDNNTGWVAAVLAVKSFPSVFGVPWHWNFVRVESALDLIADVATNMGALSLPNLFVQDGLPGEMAWLEGLNQNQKPKPWIIDFFSELLDGPLPLDKVKQVMLGCNPRSVVGLFKRYLVRIVWVCRCFSSFVQRIFFLLRLCLPRCPWRCERRCEQLGVMVLLLLQLEQH